MNRHLLCALLGALWVTHPACARTTAEPPALPSSRVERVVLENGLTLLLEEDHRVPLAAFAVRIRGGANAEGPRLGSGASHFIEHLLFKGTPTRVVGEVDRQVRSYGGDVNAFTGSDYTGVNLTAGAPFLRQAAAVLADVLQHSTFEAQEIDKERLVVHSEMQMRRDDPDQYLRERFYATAYHLHPYRESILGRQALFDQLTREDLLALYHQQYVANNMVIAVVGDFRIAEALPALTQVFGAMTPGAPLPLAYPQEPEQVNTRRLTEYKPAHLSQFVLGFHSTALTEPDTFALDVLAQALGQGESSRLTQRLRNRDRLVYSIGAWNYTPADPGLFTIAAACEPASVEAASEAIHDEIARVQRQGLTPQELAKARRQVASAFITSRQTIESKADDLALNELTTGDYDFSRTYLEGISSVTVADVRRVANEYLFPANETIAILHPEVAAPAAPAPAAERGMPTVRKTVLGNGVTVLTQEDHRLPLVSLVLTAPGGVRAETAQTNGLSNLTAQWLLKGTRRRAAEQLAGRVESWGGSLRAFSGRDAWGVQLDVLQPQAQEALSLLAEVLTQPAWSAEEGQRLKEQIIGEIRQQQDDIFFVAGQTLREGLFPAHPYRLSPLGTEASVRGLTVEQARRFHQQATRPEQLILAVFGDMDTEQVLRQAARQFGARPKAAAPPLPSPPPEPPLAQTLRLRATMPKQQGVIMVGFRGTRWIDDDRYPLELLGAWLSGLGGALFNELRDQQGLAYTLGAYPVFGQDPGLWLYYAATRPEDLDRTQRALEGFLERLPRRTIDAEDLERTKAHLLGDFRSELQSTAGWALRSALDERQGLGFDAYRRYEERINGLTPQDLAQVIQRYIASAAYVVVRVEPPKRIPSAVEGEH